MEIAPAIPIGNRSVSIVDPHPVVEGGRAEVQAFRRSSARRVEVWIGQRRPCYTQGTLERPRLFHNGPRLQFADGIQAGGPRAKVRAGPLVGRL